MSGYFIDRLHFWLHSHDRSRRVVGWSWPHWWCSTLNRLHAKRGPMCVSAPAGGEYLEKGGAPNSK